ncbi:Serine/threonine-protein phosphatase 6 regulatory ankyrin repeat subunit B [Cytospora mali]|uniref:Serine/threonine-protein phosphatase 6 regulatory ankyrin repeat subunit B n=1 Tax=Cytospora mali TaxID=578113 RepID=A0A194VEQ8_CYTMA|nr:Serine/threonine-protein phosphatase 6 regulatory ankyrin repeat subunit B [Valsa mali var. pyri (nom. inval.)]
MSRETDMELDANVNILNAIARAKGFKLCLRRIWAVAESLPDKAKSLPSLIPDPDMFSIPGHSLQHHEHEQCTFDFCEYSRVDFTSVAQRHEELYCEKGGHRECKRLEFVLANGMGEKNAAVWNLDGQPLLDSSLPYMAISHVWADGTGAGTWGSGKVNTCLWKFFCEIAHQFQCEGCWWDIISIPEKKAARAKALNNMQSNYADARITLVHDLYLRSWEWVDAEKACFAIVMSPWYSRGWTALELAKSHKVKILFKGRNDGYVIKDLDVDILDKIKDSSSQYATAESIRKLRKASLKSVNDLLAILGPRDTSKPRDVPIISGLLAGVHVYGELPQQVLYQRILRKLGKVAQGHLFHNSATMSSPGFSWCPTNILDMPRAEDGDAELLELHENGDLEGEWKVYATDSIESGHLIWKDIHPLTKVSLKSALEGKDKDKHVFLVENRDDQSRALLVRLMKDKKSPSTLCGQFIGPVYFRDPLPQAKEHVKEKIKIGSTENLQELEGTAWNVLSPSNGGNVKTNTAGASSKEYSGAAGTQTPDSKSGIEISEDQKANPGAEDPKTTGAVSTASNLKDCKAILYVDAKANYMLFQDDNRIPISKNSSSEKPETMVLYYKTFDTVSALPGPGFFTPQLSGRFFYGHKQMIEKTKEWFNKNQISNTSNTTEKLTLLGLDGDNIKVNQNDEQTKLLAGDALHLLIHTEEQNIREKENIGLLVDLLLNNDAQHTFELPKQNLLHSALQKGKIRIVEKLLTNKKNSASMDTMPNAEGKTAIHLAAGEARPDVEKAPLYETVAKLLVEKTEDLNIQEPFREKTALHLAAESGNNFLAESLIGRGARTDIEDSDRHTALYYAAKNGHEEIVTALLEHAENEKKTNHGDHSSGDIPNRNSALMIAAEDGHAHVVDILINSDPNSLKQEDLGNALLLAAKGKHKEAIRKLHNAGAKSSINIHMEGMTALHLTIEAGDEESSKLLIQNQVDVNAQDHKKKQSALHLAADKGMIGAVEALLDKKADVKLADSYKRTALHWAAIRGNVEIMAALLADKMLTNIQIQELINTPDHHKRTSLHWAVCQGSINAMKLILDNVPQYDAQDKDDRTALILAAERGNLKAIEELLAKGSSPGKTDKVHMTALDWAATNGHEDVVRKLLDKTEEDEARKKAMDLAMKNDHLSVAIKIQEHIGDPSLRSSAMTSILFLASATTTSYTDEVRDLTKNVTDLNQKDKEGRTALMLSVKSKNHRLTSRLLSLGANTNLRDNNGKTALMMATESEDLPVMEELLSAHADPKVQDNQGYTSLHHASESNPSLASIQLLLDHGTDPDTQDNRSRTALHLLLERLRQILDNPQQFVTDYHIHQFRPIINVLLGKNARLELKDEQGQTPLHLAAYMDQTIGIQLLNHLKSQHPSPNMDIRDSEGRTPLLLAAEKGYGDLVKRLLELNLKPNTQNNKGQTPLLLAAERGHCPTVEALLEKEADPNIKDVEGRTPLSQAARNGKEAVVKNLLETNKLNSNVDIRDAMGRTALLRAAENGQVEIVTMLQKSKANLTLKDYQGKNAWQRAMEKGHTAIINNLLDEVEVPIGDRKDINKALLSASRTGWTELVEVLLKKKADTTFQNEKGWTALHLAAMNGHQEVVTRLLDTNSTSVIKDTKGGTALLHAAEHGFGSIVSLLLDKGEAKDDLSGWKGPEALLLAAEKGYTNIVELLLNNNVNLNFVNSVNQTAMALAAANGYKAIVKLLLERKADSTIKDNHDRTALHHAAWGGYEDVVKILLKHNADLSALDKRGQSALHLAAERASEEVVKKLLDKRPNANAKSNDGQTALHRAAWGGSHKVVTLLLNNGGDPSIRDKSGNRPWQVAAEKGHNLIVEALVRDEKILADDRILARKGLLFAAEKGYVDIARLLLNKGADADMKDDNGLTPLHWAMKRGDQALVNLLVDEGEATVNALDKERRTPLFLGVLENQATVVNLLLHKTADANIADKNGRTALHHAAHNGNLEIVRILVDHKADPHARDPKKKAWELAADQGYDKIVDLLLEKELDLRPQSPKMEKLLLQMAEKGWVSMVQLLVDKGVNKDAEDHLGRVPIGIAAEHGKEDVLELLLLKGADPGISDLRGQTPILWAAEAGNAKIINSLLENLNNVASKSGHKASGEASSDNDRTAANGDTTKSTEETNGKAKIINHVDREGRTALLIALKKGDDNVARLLLRKGSPEIDVNLKDITGRTALHLAAERGNPNLVQLLLEKGADRKLQDKLDQTALLLAVEQGQNHVVNALLGSSSNSTKPTDFIDLQDRRNRTALLVAAERGHKEMVEKLVDLGANVNHKDKQKRTALTLATENGRKEIVETLLRQRADQEQKDPDEIESLFAAVANGDKVLTEIFLNRISGQLIIKKDLQEGV